MVIFFLFLMISQSAWVFSGDRSRTYPGFFPSDLAGCLKHGDCIESTDSEVDLGDDMYVQKIVSERDNNNGFRPSWFRIKNSPKPKNHEIYQIINKKTGKKLICSQGIMKELQGEKTIKKLVVEVVEFPECKLKETKKFLNALERFAKLQWRRK